MSDKLKLAEKQKISNYLWKEQKQKNFLFFIFAIRRVQNYRVNTPLQNYQST